MSKQKTVDMEKMIAGMRRYIKKPEAFVREVLKAEPDAWQVEALNALATGGRLAIRAGHG